MRPGTHHGELDLSRDPVKFTTAKKNTTAPSQRDAGSRIPTAGRAEPPVRPTDGVPTLGINQS